jgi:N-acetylglucosaminyldiphosphoundecaprenol N-acetyl-beta-D-mannosaminyltransferase
MLILSENPPASSPQRSDSPHLLLPSVELLGMPLLACSEQQLLQWIERELGARRGGWLVTANLDFLRRHHKDARLRSLYGEADIRVADGMPLVWASWLQGTPLPERIAGASLIRPLAGVASRARRRLYLLGGDGDTAEVGARRLTSEYPALEVAGWSSPWLPTEPDDAAVEPLLRELRDVRAELVLVALGSPKQEWLIQKLRRALPEAWFVGVGASINFLAGRIPRAPEWMQRSGLEWVHRLALEPRRMSKRYIVQGVPFGLELLGRALLRRLASARG